MVDMANLDRVAQLIADLRNIEQATDNFDAGGTIVMFTVSPGAPRSITEGAPRLPVIVPTADMAYPPQMVDTIKAMLVQRRNEISNELGQLGVR